MSGVTRALPRQNAAGSGAEPGLLMRRWSVGAALWVLVVSMMPIHRLLLEEVGNWLQYVLIAMLVLSLAFGRVKKPFAAPVWGIFLVGAPLAAAIAGAASSIPDSTLVGVRIALLVGLAPFVFAHYIREFPPFVRRCCSGFVAVQTVSAVVALVQAGGASVFGLSANSGRTNGLAAHPNVLGLMATVAILVCLYAMRGAPTRRKLILTLIAVVNVAAVVTTGSLSSMLSLAVAAIVLTICMRTTLKWFLGLIVVVIAGGVAAVLTGRDLFAFADPIQERIDIVTGAAEGVASLGIRQATYQYAWEHIAESPILGVGMDSMNQGTFNGVTVVHNYLLRFWFQGGLLFFLLIVAVTIALLVIVFRSLRRGDNALASAVIVLIGVYAMTSAFFDTQQYWVVLLFAAASVRIGDEKRNLGSQVQHRSA